MLLFKVIAVIVEFMAFLGFEPISESVSFFKTLENVDVFYRGFLQDDTLQNLFLLEQKQKIMRQWFLLV